MTRPIRRSPRHWIYAVISVPGREALLEHTLYSLDRAGFSNPLVRIDDNPRLGAYPRWYLTLTELYATNSNCHRYAIFQDDFVTYPYLRDYLDSCKFPDRGYWNLFTWPSNQQLATDNGSSGWFESNQMGRGAVALVFDLATVLDLLSSEFLVERFRDVHRRHKSIDGAVVTALKPKGYTEYVHNPSLVQHTGEVSSMPGTKIFTPSKSFLGEDFDARKLIEGTEKYAFRG